MALLDLTYRQWWTVDLAALALTVVCAVAIDLSLLLLAGGYVIVDRSIAYYLTGDLLAQPDYGEAGDSQEYKYQ